MKGRAEGLILLAMVIGLLLASLLRAVCWFFGRRLDEAGRLLPYRFNPKKRTQDPVAPWETSLPPIGVSLLMFGSFWEWLAGVACIATFVYLVLACLGDQDEGQNGGRGFEPRPPHQTELSFR